jgi:hypothetical protein
MNTNEKIFNLYGLLEEDFYIEDILAEILWSN